MCYEWDDAHCLKFLENCYQALPDNGKVIVAECILPVVPDTSLATKTAVHIDVIMLAYNTGGKARTEKEFEALAKGAGFQGFKVVCCAFNSWIMEFCKTAWASSLVSIASSLWVSWFYIVSSFISGFILCMKLLYNEIRSYFCHFLYQIRFFMLISQSIMISSNLQKWKRSYPLCSKTWYQS